MGSCGCGDFAGKYRFPGPGDVVYVLETYPGCDYCDTPAGVVVHRFRDVDEERFWFESLPELPFRNHRGNPTADDDTCSEFFQPVIHPEKVMERMVKLGASFQVTDDGDQFQLSELIEADPYEWRECVVGAIGDALYPPSDERRG